jgi:hypothetical protein
MQRVSLAYGLALMLALNCAHAEDLHALQACTRLGDNAARLSCYDVAMGVAAVGTPPRTQFGDDGQLHTKTDAALPKDLSARVREVTPLPGGLYRLTLDNGEVWDTTQADSAIAFKPEDAVSISRGWLGSYHISLAGHNTSVGVARKQ